MKYRVIVIQNKWPRCPNQSALIEVDCSPVARESAESENEVSRVLGLKWGSPKTKVEGESGLVIRRQNFYMKPVEDILQPYLGI